MPRISRLVIPEYPHHITQRGNYKQSTFTSDEDYICYLNLLQEYSKKHGSLILAYCLMPNHVHFIAIPKAMTSLALTFKLTHMRYSLYHNAKHKRVGHLWQGRFFSCVLDANHLYATVRYIENNPVKAGLVENPEGWRWSSARYHLSGVQENTIELSDISDFIKIDDWRAYLSEKDDQTMIETIKTNTRTGRPAGSDAFIEKLEHLVGSRLIPSKGGRPKTKT